MAFTDTLKRKLNLARQINSCRTIPETIPVLFWMRSRFHKLNSEIQLVDKWMDGWLE